MTSLGGKLVHPFPSPSTSNATFSIQQAIEKNSSGVSNLPMFGWFWMFKKPIKCDLFGQYLDNIWLVKQKHLQQHIQRVVVMVDCAKRHGGSKRPLLLER